MTRLMGNETLVRIEIKDEDLRGEAHTLLDAWQPGASPYHDPVRQTASVTLLAPEGVEIQVDWPLEPITERGQMTEFYRREPKTFSFELQDVGHEFALPFTGIPVWVYVRTGAGLDVYHMMLMVAMRQDGNLSFTGVDLTPPPTPPAPCPACEKRKRKKARKQRLKAGRKRFGVDFKTLEQLEAYEDGWEAAQDW